MNHVGTWAHLRDNTCVRWQHPYSATRAHRVAPRHGRGHCLSDIRDAWARHVRRHRRRVLSSPTRLRSPDSKQIVKLRHDIRRMSCYPDEYSAWSTLGPTTVLPRLPVSLEAGIIRLTEMREAAPQRHASRVPSAWLPIHSTRRLTAAGDDSRIGLQTSGGQTNAEARQTDPTGPRSQAD